MKHYLMIPAILFISTSANASTYNSEVKALYSKKLVESIIKQQMSKRRSHEEALSIDGHSDYIQISQEHTSLPEEYIDMPVKPKREHYTGK